MSRDCIVTSTSMLRLAGEVERSLPLPACLLPFAGQRVASQLAFVFAAHDGNLESQFAICQRDIADGDVTLTNGELAFKVPVVRGEYKGKLAGNTLTGEWQQAGGQGKAPLNLTRQP